MSLETNDNLTEVVLVEVSKDDCFYDVLQKVAKHIQIRLKGAAARMGIGVWFGSFTGNLVDRYYVKENGSGITEGLFKIVDGQPVPILLPLASSGQGEQGVLWFGDGTSELVPPPGWEIVTDSEIRNKYFLGTGPNWKVAVIRYVGI